MIFLRDNCVFWKQYYNLPNQNVRNIAKKNGNIYKTGEFPHGIAVFGCFLVFWVYMLLVSVVVSILSRCFGSAFSDSCVVAEQELVRRSQLLGGRPVYPGR